MQTALISTRFSAVCIHNAMGSAGGPGSYLRYECFEI